MNIEAAGRMFNNVARGMIDAHGNYAGNMELFLKIDGIEGECQDDKHKGEIELNGFNFLGWQGSSAGSGGGSTSGKVSFVPITLRGWASKATPKIFLACAKGEKIKSIVVSGRMGPETDGCFKMTLTNAVIYYYNQNFGIHHSGTDVIEDFLLVTYDKAEIEFRTIQEDGKLGPPVKAGWDIKQNTKV